MIDRRGIIAGAVALPITAVADPSAVGPVKLGPIRAVTTTAAELLAVRTAYERYLGYRVVAMGRVPAGTARSWSAPAVAGARMLIMAPASGQATLLRFVEQPMQADFKPMTTLGWNATEIIVQDADAVAARLADSPFRIVGPPRDLSSSSEIRAMQAIGPANEMLYLTCTKHPMPGRDMPTAEAFIGRAFIAVVGGRDMAAMTDFYQRTFGNVVSPPFTTPIGTLSHQNGMPPDTHYRLAVMQLGGGTKLELDQVSPTAPPRPRPQGGLPVGMAIVSFDCPNIDRFASSMAAPARASEIEPFRGRRVGVVTGAAGELIELIES